MLPLLYSIGQAGTEAARFNHTPQLLMGSAKELRTVFHLLPSTYKQSLVVHFGLECLSHPVLFFKILFLKLSGRYCSRVISPNLS